MAAARKPRPDAILKTLPDAVQDQLMEICRSPAAADSPGGYQAAREWLKDKHGIEVRSDATFSKFYAWYPFSRPLELAARLAKQGEEAMKNNPKLKLDREQISELAQISFENMAVLTQDLKGFAVIGKGEREQQRLRLEREKFEWSKKTDIEKGLTALHAEIEGDEEAARLYDAFATYIRTKKKGGKK
jgi:hypothetical protein